MFFYHREDGSFHVKDMNGDGNCLFRAMSYVILGRQNRQDIMRSEIVSYICSNWDFFGNFYDEYTEDSYRSYMGADGIYGGEPEIVAFTRIYGCRVRVYYKGKEDRAPECYGEGGPTCFLLYYSGRGAYAHYDVLKPTSSSIHDRFEYDASMEVLRS